MSDKLGLNARQEVDELSAEIKAKGNSSPEVYNKLLNKLSEAQNKMTNNNVIAFSQFVKQYPNSDISTHLMEKLNYEDDPAGYYAIYKTLTPTAKNTDEGKEIGDKLSHLIKLVVGVKAPLIYGKTPDGKTFDPKTIKSKVIFVDFWRASNEFSRRNHLKLIDVLRDVKDKGKFGIISVSLDTKADWWTNAINEDNMTWTQVSDLKGDDSPNAVNWSISSIPTYYLLDSNWKIVERNIDIGKLDFELNDYLNKHH
jgi:Thioredoxin-like